MQQGWLDWSAVEVTTTSIAVAGTAVLELEAGVVPAGAKRGVLIMPLFDVLTERANQATARREVTGGALPFAGRLLAVVDAAVPFSVVQGVIYTAAQSQYSEVAFLIAGGAPAAAPPPAMGSRQVMLGMGADGPCC